MLAGVLTSTTSEAKTNQIVEVPIEAAYEQFQWYPSFENDNHDLIVSYGYQLHGRLRRHYFNVETGTDLNPAAAERLATEPGARRDFEARAQLESIATNEFDAFDLPNGSRFVEDSIYTGSKQCQWPYAELAAVHHDGQPTRRLALFVPLDRPRLITLEHHCQGFGDSDEVKLQFEQSRLQAVYSPRDALYVRCVGLCGGPPRLLRMELGGIEDLLREFRLIAVPASDIQDAQTALANMHLSAQEAIDAAEAAIMRQRAGKLPPP